MISSCCNAEVDQVIELANRRVEGSLRREGANVQLVNDQFGNAWRRPCAIAPCVIAWVNHLPGAVDAVRIETRSRIGPVASFKSILVAIARASVRINCVEIAAGLLD